MSEDQNTEQVKVKDESQDQKYFTITPRLVWALARNPYDYTLWATIKGIAGESGECFLSTEELAILSMMSVGQAHDSRKYWMEMKMLFGDLRKDPGYPQQVWHLSIPNIWAINIEWATKFASLKDRVKFKREQLASIRENRKKEREEAKKDEKPEAEAIHPMKPSPDEGSHSYGEPEHSPSELKNIHKENQKEVGASAPPSVWGIGWQVAAGVEEVQVPTQDEQLQSRISDAVGMFAPNYQPLAKAFILATEIFPIKKDVANWQGAFKDQIARTGLSPEDVTEACKLQRKDGLTLKDPHSIMNKIADIRAGRKQKQIKAAQPQSVDTPFARALAKRNLTPNGMNS